MKNKTIPLLVPILWGSNKIQQLVFREPKMSDIIEFGEPIIYTRSANGAAVAIENMDAIGGYARSLLVEPFGGGGLIDHLELPDALAVKDAITDFFSDARRKASADGPGSSSVISDGQVAANSPE